MARKILVVDDDPLLRSLLTTVLREEGYLVAEAKGGREALGKLEAEGFDVVVTDLRMPELSGLELLAKGKTVRPEARWIVITAFGSIESAVQAVKAGASDYLTKPLRSPEELRHVVRRVLREAEAEQRLQVLAEDAGRGFPPLDLIFLGRRMAEVRRLVEEVAPTPATVLLSGPSGTGKELVARVLHALSPRRDAPFVAVHCAALAEALLESELFGHERGAFTGAVAARKGRFEVADGGTLFLDEVGEVALSIQVKLLRVLQEREFERVGGTRPIPVDVRVVSATNRDLRADTAGGRFREDLFYRLNVFPIVLPPLAERPEAVEPLARYFAEKYSKSLGKACPSLAAPAVEALRAYPWPGNVRELQNVMERAVILAGAEIGRRELSLDAGPQTLQSRGGPPEGVLRAGEREAIRKVLAEVGGNRTRAAKILGISLRTLQYRIKEFGL